MPIFASFVVAAVQGRIAATTRAADRGEAGKIGLPGGKVDLGESARTAAIREAREEGYLVYGVDQKPFHTATVDGKTVAWFAAKGAVRLSRFKEKGRITPIWSTIDEIARSGYGNDLAIKVWESTHE